jgi:hypothetical protein
MVDVCQNTYIPDIICFALQAHQIVDVDHGHSDQRLDPNKQFLLLIP